MEEKVFVKNHKGLSLASIINYSDKNKKHPAAIILHGFTGYKEEAHLASLARDLAQQGYVAIRFDASGSGDSDGTFEKDYLISNYLEDIKSIYDYLLNLDFIDKNKIIILGHSLGGGLSIIFSSLTPEIKMCVAISPVSTLIESSWIKGIKIEWEKTGWFDKEYSKTGAQIKIPYSFVEDCKKFNSINSVAEVHCPIAVVIGLIDDTVTPEDSRRIFEAANNPKELIEIEGVGHDYKKYPELVDVVNGKILAFLKKYL